MASIVWIKGTKLTNKSGALAFSSESYKSNFSYK